MLSGRHEAHYGESACNDNGRLAGMRTDARRGRGILAAASQVSGPIVLTYVAAHVLIISKQTVN